MHCLQHTSKIAAEDAALLSTTTIFCRNLSIRGTWAIITPALCGPNLYCQLSEHRITLGQKPLSYFPGLRRRSMRDQGYLSQFRIFPALSATSYTPLTYLPRIWGLPASSSFLQGQHNIYKHLPSTPLAKTKGGSKTSERSAEI